MPRTKACFGRFAGTLRTEITCIGVDGIVLALMSSVGGSGPEGGILMLFSMRKVGGEHRIWCCFHQETDDRLRQWLDDLHLGPWKGGTCQPEVSCN